MKFELIEVSGIEGALLGMRLPMCKDLSEARTKSDTTDNYNFEIGEDDLKLCKRLINGDMGAKGYGQPNAKYLRMIHAQICVTAPLYWWKEADTYKVGTTTNSTSTMHKLTSTPITMDCFECGELIYQGTIDELEMNRLKYLETKNYEDWKRLIVNLPESWLQTRMLDVDYQTLRNIYHWRKNHKLTEWHGFCDFMKTLPFSELITEE